MGLVPFKGFVGSAFGPQSPNVDRQDLINWYLEVSESPYAKTPTGLLPCPGFTTRVTLPTGPARGIFAENDRVFAVGGAFLYEIDREWNVTARPMTTLATPSAPTVTPSPLAPALAVPNTPVITHGGALGTTTYGYKVTAYNSHGQTSASVEGTSALGNATLSATNYNYIAWDRVPDAVGYKVYRTTGPGSGVLMAIVSASQAFVLDIGTTGTAATPPVTDTSGGIIGATTYGYKIVAQLGIGQTAASTEGVTITGQATLDEDNFNTITWPAIAYAHSYRVYRTTGGVTTPPVLLAVVTEATYDDIGEDGDAETPSVADTTGTFTITDDGTPVAWASSGDAGGQILIIGGGGAFCLDLENNSLAKVVSGATSGGFLDSYFVVLDAATSTLKASEQFDGFDWDDGQVYQRQGAGDRFLSMAVSGGEIFLHGSATSEVWRFTGNDETRFAPRTDVSIEQGIIAPQSLCKVAGSLMFIGQNKDGAGIIFRMANGYTPVRVSTHGIERQLESFSTLADAVAWTYEQEGHTFYVLTFPSDEATWVYDVTTGEWGKRGFFDPNDMAFTAYRPQCHAFAFGGVGFGYHLVGDRESGVIASMSVDVATDFDGQYIRRLRQTPHVASQQQMLFSHALHVDMDTGVGVSSGQGSDPTMMLQISYDGARTWGSERWRSIGAQGVNKPRVTWNRNGGSRDMVYRYITTDPVPYRVAAASFEMEQGTH